jgi:hypothetical protein
MDLKKQQLGTVLNGPVEAGTGLLNRTETHFRSRVKGVENMTKTGARDCGKGV